MNNADTSIYTPPGGPPQAPPPQGLWEAMGTERLYALSEDFYQRLGTSSIADMFPQDLIAASKKQAAFLIGILGGPPLYQQTYGHPRMRQRHGPFAIDETARREWLRCFREALQDGDDYGLSPEQASELLTWLEAFSGWMVNRAPKKSDA